MTRVSGAFAASAAATAFTIRVLPERGGATIKPRVPFASGAYRSIARPIRPPALPAST